VTAKRYRLRLHDRIYDAILFAFIAVLMVFLMRTCAAITAHTDGYEQRSSTFMRANWGMAA
jgi:hypothetical protein